jgi:hypothetical protein
MGGKTVNLFLQISGSATELQRATKAGRASLAELGDAAGNLQQVVADNFRKLGGPSIIDSARQMEATFKRSLNNIRAAAVETLGKPITASTILTNFSGGGEASLAAARNEAAGFRELADTQAALIALKPNVTAGERELAVALELSALRASEQVAAIDAQLAPLRALRGALGDTAVAEEEVSAAHARTGASGMILQHIVRSTGDSFAAGLPPAMIFAEQMGRVSEALQFAAMESGNTTGAMGKLAGFLTSGWGLAAQVAVTVGATLARTLLDGAGAAKEDAKAKDSLKEAVDRLDGAQASLNHETRQGIIDDINAANATRQREIATRGLLQAELQRAKTLAAATEKAPTSGAGLDEGAQFTRGATFAQENKKAASFDAQLTANQQLIDKANRDILTGTTKLINRDVEAATDPRSAITQRFQDRSNSIERQYQAGKITPTAYRAQLLDATTTRDNGLEALKPEPRGRRPRVDHTVEREANKDRSYQTELGSAQDGYAKAILALSDTAAARLQVEQDQLYAANIQKGLELDDQVTAKKLTQAQADRLREIYSATEVLAEISAMDRKRASDIDALAAKDRAEIDGKIAVLDLQSGLADTMKARRDLQLRLLALDESRERAAAQAVLDKPDSIPGSKEAKEAATKKIAAIDELHPLKVKEIEQHTESPLAAYKRQLTGAVGDTNEALQGVAVDGLKGLDDGLTGLLDGTESVAAAFKKMSTSIIEDLARIAIEKGIVSLLGGSIFGISIGGKKDGGILGFAGGGTPSRAGGRISGPGTGRSDSILAMLGGRKPIMVSNGESIVTADATSRYWSVIDAMNKGTLDGFAGGGFLNPASIRMRDISPADIKSLSSRGGSSQAPITFDLRGAVMTQDLIDQMHRIAAATGTAAMVGAVRLSRAELAEEQHQSIP